MSVLTLKRSILTEKIARRGYHLTREYESDPLHALLVRDVMSTDVLTVAASRAPRSCTSACRRAAPGAASGCTR